MDEKLNPETQDKQTAPEVNAETLEQVNGGYTVSGEAVAAATGAMCKSLPKPPASNY